MSDQPKRLSDVTKKQTIDRASKLASSFLPDPDDQEPQPAPIVSVPAAAPVAESLPDVIQQGEADFSAGKGVVLTSEEVREMNPVASPPKTSPVTTAERPKERTRRSAPAVDLTEILSQPTPEGLRCTRMIMLSDEHHDMLRELHFRLKKPMTTLLYNLLEPAHQALQREKTKGN